MRPVPSLRRRMAFSDHLYLRILLEGNEHEAHRDFWMWYETFPHRGHDVCDLLWRLPCEEVPLVIVKRLLGRELADDLGENGFEEAERTEERSGGNPTARRQRGWCERLSQCSMQLVSINQPPRDLRFSLDRRRSER